MFLGCEDNQTTKTILIFMIKSAGGKYMDVVALVPVAKVNAEFINNQLSRLFIKSGSLTLPYRLTTKQLIQISTLSLCYGELQTLIPHPHNSSRNGYLLFNIK
uniref:Uncharacterized protein n=1 Tax=Lepeophtheirus salmonis TaxID=72036 RepID=A0A0K2T2W4_LEPSM